MESSPAIISSHLNNIVSRNFRIGPLNLIDSVLSFLNDSLLLMHDFVITTSALLSRYKLLRSAVQLFNLRLAHTEVYFYPIWQQVGCHKDNNKEEVISLQRYV